MPDIVECRRCLDNSVGSGVNHPVPGLQRASIGLCLGHVPAGKIQHPILVFFVSTRPLLKQAEAWSEELDAFSSDLKASVCAFDVSDYYEQRPARSRNGLLFGFRRLDGVSLAPCFHRKTALEKPEKASSGKK
jgi:hypothetical protein